MKLEKIELEKKIIDIIHQKTNKDNITKDTELKNLGIDSLDLLDLVIEAEHKFNIHLEDDRLITLKTVDDFIKEIKSKL